MGSRKNNLLKFQTITNGDMTTALTSAVTNIQFLDNIAIQLDFAGTPTGTFQVQVSVDHAQDNNGNVTVAGSWVPLLLSSNPVAAGTSGTIYIDLNQLSAPYMRVTYTGTGAGTLNAFVSAKTI